MNSMTDLAAEARGSHGLIAAMRKVRGAAWLGKVNGHGRRTLWGFHLPY
jgi:hypothetical protein